MSRSLAFAAALALIIFVLPTAWSQEAGAPASFNGSFNDSSPASSPASFNGTVYCLGTTEIEVFKPVVPGDMKLVLGQKAGEIALLAPDGARTVPNITQSFWRGEYIYDISIEDSGRLTYTIPHQGQQLILPVRDEGAVKVILPEGYTTGDRTLGIARPEPDEIAETEEGLSLIWRDTSDYQIIEVGYYLEKAPKAMKIVLLILVLAAAAIFLEYYTSIRRLRAIREGVEGKRA